MDVIQLKALVGSNRPYRGFSLIELLTTLTVMGIAISLALPSFSKFIQHNRLVTSINTMVSSLNYARSEAIKLNQTIVICKGTAATGCDNTRAWRDGWIVFSDKNHDRLWSDDEVLLWTQEALSPGIALSWNAFPSANYTIFYPNGTSSSNGTFIFCDSRTDLAAKALILAKTGRIRNSDKSANGTVLQCS
ncbi:MAG: GspH/FimT family pseudopilin [Thiohalomonadaceae bacterium]